MKIYKVMQDGGKGRVNIINIINIINLMQEGKMREENRERHGCERFGWSRGFVRIGLRS